MIVLLSVAASIGVFGFVGVPATLIIFEIIPFLVLAVGVDNIFILVQTYQREPRRSSETHAEHVGRVTGEVAPSMLLSSVSESTCFFLGALTDMPAVRAFALYAGMALLIDFFMQITCFIALISLDTARQENNRWDVFCCKGASKKYTDTADANEGAMYKLFKHFYAPFLMKKWVRPSVVVIFFGWLCFSLSTVNKIEIGLDQELSMPDDSFVLKYFQYLNKYLSVGPPMYIVVNNTGLRFDFANKTLQKRLCGSGDCDPYSVVNQINLWSKEANVTYIASSAQSWVDDYRSWAMQKECCKWNGTTDKVCQVNPAPSRTNHLLKKGMKTRHKRSDTAPSPKMTTTADEDDWFGNDDSSDSFGSFDTFDDYDDDTSEPQQTNHSTTETNQQLKDDRLPDSFFSEYDEFYDYYYDEEPPTNHRRQKCNKCLDRSKNTRNDAFSEKDFRSLLKYFLDQDPGEVCAVAGHAAYIDSVKLVPHRENSKTKQQQISLHDKAFSATTYPHTLVQHDVAASSFMTFHTILRTSKDYYEALRWARKLTDNLTEMLNEGLEFGEEPINVFPYSIFYVFYEQYLTMWEDTLRSLSISLVAIFTVTFILMGLDLRSSLIIVLIILMILVNLGGLMYWWHITLNAVSLVNLVMAVGISVEFCAHITRAFAVNVGDNKIARARDTLVNMGSSVSQFTS